MPIDMKAVIANTFSKMLEHKSIDKITVKAVLDECHISRQTFYYHFRDIMDVLEWSFHQAIQHILKQSLEAEDIRSALQYFVSFTIKHYSKIRRLMDSQRRKQIELIMIETVTTYLKELTKQKRPDLAVTLGDMEIVIRYNACGILGVLIMCGEKANFDQERLLQLFEWILSGELSEWAKNLPSHPIDSNIQND